LRQLLSPAASVEDEGVTSGESLYREGVPHELDPQRFFEVMINRVLDNSPINFHGEARARRRDGLT